MLIWADGFDRYGAAADFALNYSPFGTLTYNASGGAYGPGNMQSTNTFSGLTKSFSPTVSMTAGGMFHGLFWFKATSLVNQCIFNFGTNVFGVNDGREPRLYLSSSGHLQANKTGSFGAEFSSASGVIATATWYCIEWRAKYNTNANGGFIKIYVNGNLVLDSTGTDVVTDVGAIPTTWTGCQFPASNNIGRNLLWDDVILWDETGSDFVYTVMSSAFLPVIETLSVNGNNVVQFTPSTGSNFQNVDDPAFYNSDTDYNSSATVGQQDTFTLTPQTGTPSQTFGLVFHTVAKVDVASIVNMRVILNKNSTTVESADKNMTTSYQGFIDGYGINPDTGAAWGVSDVNSVHPGYKLQLRAT